MKLRNEQKITEIIMHPKAACWCPLGNDWYTNELTIEFSPDKYFPDYCDIEKFLDNHIRGKELIIEDVVDKIYQYLINEYAPIYLKVSSNVNDVTSHSPVIVTKG